MGLSSAAQHDELIRAFSLTVPALDGSNYKGQHGKVGVVGGCDAYTGAPFFAALSAHKVGADLTYILCTPRAAPVIKAYSPDLIVLPLLLDDGSCQRAGREVVARAVLQQLGEVDTWLRRMSVVVVGPGLGESPEPQASAEKLITLAREAGLPLVIDGSGVATVVRNPSLVMGYRRCVITPNMAELGRLAACLGVRLPNAIGAHWQEYAPQVAAALQGPVLVSKGPQDVITDGTSTVKCTVPGSLKRCGGIGDVLAGSVGAFLGWQYTTRKPGQGEPTVSHLLAASYAACAVVRQASSAAFELEGRAMSAEDVIRQLPKAFVHYFKL